jgi:ribosomal protein S18 acetylase RimI-like enzyme
MVVWREVATTEESAEALLGEYFRERALSFPAEQGHYRTVFPDPAHFVPPAGVFLIASLDDSAGEHADIGCGGVRSVPPSPDGDIRYEIKHLYLRPKARGRGYGRLLLAELEARAAGFGAREVVLDTNVSQVAAAHLYVASGYREIPPYNSNANATTWFAKRL